MAAPPPKELGVSSRRGWGGGGRGGLDDGEVVLEGVDGGDDGEEPGNLRPGAVAGEPQEDD